MFHAAVWGRLAYDPREIDTKSGKAMTVATVAVDVEQGESEPPEWVSIAVYGRLAELLAHHQRGDPLSVSGRVRRRSWTDKTTGEQRMQLSISADAIVSSRSPRPSGGRKRGIGGRKATKATDGRPIKQSDLNDPLPQW